MIAFDPEIESLGAQVALQALLAASLILTAFLFASPDLREPRRREALGLRRPLRKPIWLAVATYFGYIGCAIVISLLLAPEQEDITRELGGDSGSVGTVIAGFLIVIVAPVSEEIFFRGFLFRGHAPDDAAGSWPRCWRARSGACFHYTGPGHLGRGRPDHRLRPLALVAVRAHRIDLSDDRRAHGQQRDRVHDPDQLLSAGRPVGATRRAVLLQFRA